MVVVLLLRSLASLMLVMAMRRTVYHTIVEVRLVPCVVLDHRHRPTLGLPRLNGLDQAPTFVQPHSTPRVATRSDDPSHQVGVGVGVGVVALVRVRVAAASEEHQANYSRYWV